MDLIDRNALFEFPIREDHCDKEHANEDFIMGIESVMEYAGKLPSVEAVPVVHGHWLETDAYPHHVYCSKCFRTFVNDKNWLKSNGGSIDDAEYCPHCHAKMDEVSE